MMELQPHRKAEQGIYIVLFALMLVFIISLAGLVIGLGYMAAGHGRFQRITNLVALAALEKFEQVRVTDDAEPQPAEYKYKADEALARANEVFALNRLPGFTASFGGINYADVEQGGRLTLGKWYKEQPAEDPEECAGKYPCFVPNSAPAAGVPQEANAVRVELANTDDNPFDFPLCGFFGSCGRQLKAEAYATLIQRCTAFVVDLSASSYFSTHRLHRGTMAPHGYILPGEAGYSKLTDNKCNGLQKVAADEIYYCAADDATPDPPAPVDIALPFYRLEALKTGGLDFASLPGDVAAVSAVSGCHRDVSFTSKEQYWWCNMSREGKLNYASRRESESFTTRHYRSDYVARKYRVPDGLGGHVDKWMLVDSFVNPPYYEGPRPYASFFHAFNATLRLLEQQASAGDKAMLRGFTGIVSGKYPVTADASEDQLTPDIGPMIQITNLKNRGTIDKARNVIDAEMRPNILDYGFYWLMDGWATDLANNSNHILALNEAINVLTNECPTSSLRTIVMATDGIPTCYVTGGNQLSTTDPGHFTCDSNRLQNYYNAYWQLIDLTMSQSVLRRLQENQISLIALQAGDHIGLNWRNKPDPDGDPMDPAESYARGGSRNNTFDLSYACPGHNWGCDPVYTYANIGLPSFLFRTPIGLMADLSIKSGGVYCPLMPVCGTSGKQPPGGICDSCCGGGTCCYEDHDADSSTPCKLKPAYRPAGYYSMQKCSLYHLDEGEQAAKCVTDFLGGSPYVLVVPRQ